MFSPTINYNSLGDGIRVKYYDHEFFEHIGTAIIDMTVDDNDNHYLIIVDDIPENNNKTLTLIDGRVVQYGEIRISTDCHILSEN